MQYGAEFPQYLSKPYQVLWFEPDDMAIAIVSLIIFGIRIGGVFWILVILAPIGYSRLKRNYPRGFIKHMGYFLGLTPFKGYPTYFQQKFVE